MTSAASAAPVRRRRRTSTSTKLALAAVAAASGLLAALSGAEPSGSSVADVVWCALAGVAVPLAGSRARRWPALWAGAVAAVVGIGGDAVARIGSLALLVVLGVTTFSTRRDRLQGAVLGALAVNVLLRGPSYGPVGVPTLVALGALAPVCWSGFRLARPRERRLAIGVAVVAVAVCVLGAGLAAIGALGARDDLQAGADEAEVGLDQLRSGDTAGAATTFEQASATFDEGAEALSGWTLLGRYVPVVGQHVEALETVADAGADLTASAATTASSADYRSLTALNGQVDLDQIVALQEPVADSAAVAVAALDSVGSARSPWLVPLVGDELVRFEDRLADVAEQATLASEGLAVAPALLGADGPRSYFVAFASPSETRNGGGYVGAYGLLVTDGGRMDLLEAGDLNALNPTDATQPYAFDPPQDWQERYGDYYVQLFLGNLSASPDWPTDAGVAGQLFPQTPGGRPIDGALYVDPTAIAALLSLTGPVEVPSLGVTLDASNAARFLSLDQYAAIDPLNPQRKESLGEVAQATFDALTSRPLPGIADLTDVLGPLVTQGHLRFSVTEPRAEALFDRTGLSGRWAPDPQADYLSVRAADLLTNKIDAYLQRSIDVSSTVDPGDGSIRTTVAVTLTNSAPASDAGADDYVVGNSRGLPPGTNVDLLTLHSPLAIVSASLDGQPAPVARQAEGGGPVYSVVAELPPGSTRTVVFELAGGVRGWPYRLEWLPQPMVNPDQLTVGVEGLPGSEKVLKYAGTGADQMLLAN